MKTIVSEFFRRGLIASGFGPIVLAILYLILKHKTGLDQDVRDYVMQTKESKEFYERLVNFIDFSMLRV